MAFGLIFDMDGVLFDSHPAHRKVWRELLQSLGKPVSDGELDFIMDGARREEILRHFLGPLSPEQITAYTKHKEALFRKEEEDLQTVQGLKSFLGRTESASIPKVVATSASRARTRRMLDRHGLRNRFKAIVTADEVRKGKSDPAIFVRCARELLMPPRNVLAIEDAIPAIRTAKGIGMKCVGIGTGARGAQLREAGADLVIPDFKPLLLSQVMGLFDQKK